MRIRALGSPTFACSAAAVLLFLFHLPCSPCFSQPGAAKTPPPGHLPPLILECESGSGFNGCSVWIWQGSSYIAGWSSGATGTLRVSSGDSSQLRIQRVDSGKSAGLQGTYTGAWNGTSVVGGKLTFTFNGVSGSGSWTGETTLTPVLHQPNTYSFVNWYMSQLTAYTIFSNQGSFNQSIGAEMNDYRVRGEPIQNSGESRLFSNRYLILPESVLKGRSFAQATAIAAIYADGTTFGDPQVLAAMIAFRKSMLGAFTSIATTYCTLGMRQSSVKEIETALAMQHDAEDARSPDSIGERVAAYGLVVKSLETRGNNRRPSADVLRHTWDRINQFRSGLAADPVKDASGKLLIPTISPLACSLP
jgi:hypothetical protein